MSSDFGKMLGQDLREL